MKHYSSEIGNKVCHTPTEIFSFPKPPLRIYSATTDTPCDFKKNILILSYKIKTNRTITSYRRCYCLCSLSNCSVDLLSPLVLTVTALEISLFQVPEKQYSSFEKVQVSKIFQGMALHPQPPAE